MDNDKVDTTNDCGSLYQAIESPAQEEIVILSDDSLVSDNEEFKQKQQNNINSNDVLRSEEQNDIDQEQKITESSKLEGNMSEADTDESSQLNDLDKLFGVTEEDIASDTKGTKKEDITCPVCLGEFVDTVALICGHCMCYKCVLQTWAAAKPRVIANGKQDYECPVCRKPVDPETGVIPLYNLGNQKNEQPRPHHNLPEDLNRMRWQFAAPNDERVGIIINGFYVHGGAGRDLLETLKQFWSAFKRLLNIPTNEELAEILEMENRLNLSPVERRKRKCIRETKKLFAGVLFALIIIGFISLFVFIQRKEREIDYNNKKYLRVIYGYNN